MAKPLDDTERQTIVDLIQSGKSANAIAKETGRSVNTVSRLAKQIGWRFAQTNLAHAHEARSAYSAERRAKIAGEMTERVEKFLAQLDEPHVAFNFGGRDNTYNEQRFERPPADTALTIVRSAQTLMRTVLDIAKHDDKGDQQLSAFDEWLATARGTEPDTGPEAGG